MTYEEKEEEEEGKEKQNGVDVLIKSFEGNNLSNTSENVEKMKIMNDMFDVKKSSSSKALELINKYIDVPEPEVKNLNFICDEKKENLIETEMNELNKELEELKKEEERFNKTYVTRTTSTSSLEDEFVKRLQERNYKVIDFHFFFYLLLLFVAVFFVGGRG